MKIVLEKLTVDRERAEELEESALAVCGLLRLAANVNPDAREYVFEDGPRVWDLLIDAEINLFSAATGLRSGGASRRMAEAARGAA